MQDAQKYLDSAVLKELQKLQTWRTVLALMMDWGIIAAAIWASEYFNSWIAYCTAIAIISGRMHALGALMHDFAHVRFSRNPKLNDWVGDLTTAWPLFTMVHGYRRNHYKHHQSPNTENDPDYLAKYGRARFTFPQKHLREIGTHLLGYVLAINSLRDIRLANARLNQDMRVAKLYKALRISFYVCLLALLAWFQVIDKFFMYWVIPFFSLFMALVYVRSVAEHFAIDNIDNKLEGTRTVIPALWEKLFFGPHNVSYHLEHHIFPYVPFYNLPKLHAVLMSNPHYRAKAHITHGYVKGLLSECRKHGNYRKLPALEFA